MFKRSKAKPEGLTQLDKATRKLCPRFRILIIGKANAGKTTILQKICKTTEQPIVYRNGKKIDNPTLEGPSMERGLHNIDDEIVFESNPGFVFHDSRGFESGGVSEVEKVRKFISDRSTTTKLQDRLHVIWFCLPTDNDRPLCDAEMEFFRLGTGDVAVVAICSKYDALIIKSYNTLRNNGVPRQQAMKDAPEHARNVFKENFLQYLEAAPFPPRTHVCLQDMNLPKGDCSNLTQVTADVMDNTTLRQLFITVQQNKIELKIKMAINKDIIAKYFVNNNSFSQDQVGSMNSAVLKRFAVLFLPWWRYREREHLLYHY